VRKEVHPSQPRHLPTGLTSTVGTVESILGEVVAAAEGAALFEAVESIRQEMVAFREAEGAALKEEALDRAQGILDTLGTEERTAVARAYALYLQIVNVCENAYRTHRLREKLGPEAPARASLTFVLTAHPTESRSPENISILRRVQDHVLHALETGRPLDRREVENLLRLAWRVGTHPHAKPSVEDEAGHLFSLLSDPILTETIALAEGGHRIRFRTWVGGDKDGHPGVGAEQTHTALERGRRRLVGFVQGVLMPPVQRDVVLAAGAELAGALTDLEEALAMLASVVEGDGARIAALRVAVERFQASYRARLGAKHPAIGRLSTLLEIFPGLVVPLELREERGYFGSGDPIADMLRRLAAIARGTSVDVYARAVVVSMTSEAGDLLEAQALVHELLGDDALPVIPLFELPDVLGRAPAILREAWEDEEFRHTVQGRGHLEVMLGYSDTAKRVGMLASRVALHDAMREVGAWAEMVGVTPLFFHGHGGSVGRGGGRIEDLAATWPPVARTPYKHTVQGEMVERTFATPEILRSLVFKVAEVQAAEPPYQGVGELTRALAGASAEAFDARIGSASFRRLIEVATPYSRLEALTIGSRPSRRGAGGIDELRAIPWVLCWTQTRLLLHAWLGAGEAWRAVRSGDDVDERMRQSRAEDPLFRSYARLLSFTLAKAEPLIWRRYLRALLPDASESIVRELEDDFAAARELALRALDADTLLPDRPWLQESIRYRAPMIHPLNLLQIGLLGKQEWSEAEVRLFRETVTGIAAGMMTTG
jgi:phosphoenolpyruvate carboxylase